MDEYIGCSDGNCILRDVPLRVHTNAGCRCLRDIPTPLRIAIQRRIRRQQAEVERLRAELDETREAARCLFNEPHCGEDDERHTDALSRWPWLGEDK